MTSRRVPLAQLAPGPRRLETAAAHYVARVLRLRAGDTFVAFDPAAGLEADAATVRVHGGEVYVELGPPRTGPAGLGRDVIWVHALAKGDKADAIVRDATELGATRIAFALTERSVIRLDPATAHKRQVRWRAIAEQAARQSGRSDAPVVDAPAAWDVTLATIDDPAARFCLWPGAATALGPMLFEAIARDAPLAFACGPEGGLTPGEIALAEGHGWKGASLGPSTLRTETMAAAVLGAVRVFAGSLR